MSPHKPEWQQNNWWRVVITDIWPLERRETYTEPSTLVNACIISGEWERVAAFRLCFDPRTRPVGVVRCSLFIVADTEAPPAGTAGLDHMLRYTYLVLSLVWKYQTTSPLFHVWLRCLTTMSDYDVWPFQCANTCLNEKCARHIVNVASVQVALPLFSSPSLFVFYSSACLHQSPSLVFSCGGQLLPANELWKPSDVICSEPNGRHLPSCEGIDQNFIMFVRSWALLWMDGISVCCGRCV